MNKKKIFFIINSFSMGGGAESLLTTIVNNLDENKYDIGIMEIIHSNKKVEPIKSHIKMYQYYTEEDAPNRKSRMYYVYHEWNKVIEEYIPLDYDVYISFNYMKPTFLLPEGKKNIAWIHGDIYNLLADEKKEEKELQREALRKVERIIAVSDNTANSIRKLYPEHQNKIQVLYNGISVNKVDDLSNKSCDVNLQHPAIIAVGRLDNNKDPIRLVNVFKNVYFKRNDIHLYYLGYGNLASEVYNYCKEFNIEKNVHLLGYYENPFPIIKQADVLCMMSKSEGFPMALLEGVALGVPFVATNIGGANTLSNGGKCGQVITTDEEAENKILEIIDNGKKSYEEACKNHIKMFDLDKYIKAIEGFI